MLRRASSMNGMLAAFTVAFIAAALLSPAPSAATPGDLDTTFGNGGSVITPLDSGSNNGVRAVVRQPDGKIVVAGGAFFFNSGLTGRFVLARFAEDGTLDPAFGTGGIVSTGFGADVGAAEVLALARQSDGKLLAVGFAGDDLGTQSSWDFALARYDENGVLDPGFGTGGIVVTDLTGGQDMAVGVAVRSDGTLMVAGLGNFALARYLADGTLDTSFGGGDGFVTVTPGFPGAVLFARALVQQPDEKLVLAGQLFDIGGLIGGDNFAVARLHPDGSLDASFSGDGRVFTDFPSGSDQPLFFSGDEARAIVLQPDGKLVVGGRAAGAAPPGFLGQTVRFALARYEDDGDLDPTFGTGGLVLTDPFLNNDRVFSLVLQSDGKILAGGFADGGDPRLVALRRYNPDGHLDGSFGTCGTTVSRFGTLADVSALAVEPDGDIIAAGSHREITPQGAPPEAFLTARYEGGSVLTCATAPLAGCKAPVVPGKARLGIKNGTPDKRDNLGWKWLKGDATTLAELGDPRVDTDYVFCLYDTSAMTPALVFEAAVPAGSVCEENPCWKPPTGNGFKYSDRSRRRCGVHAMLLRAGEAEKARVVVKAKGENLPVPPLPLPLPARAQLQAGNGECWESVFLAAGVTKNDAERFKGRAD